MFCVICLLAYFRKPLEDEAPLPEFADPVERSQAESAATLARKKLCPSCRVVVTVPPTEIWAVKSMTASVDRAQKLGMGSAESNGGYEALLDPEDEEGRAMRRRERGEDLPKGEQLWESEYLSQREPCLDLRLYPCSSAEPLFQQLPFSAHFQTSSEPNLEELLSGMTMIMFIDVQSAPVRSNVESVQT